MAFVGRSLKTLRILLLIVFFFFMSIGNSVVPETLADVVMRAFDSPSSSV